ncbi:MAG: HAMP domain-containing protein [Rhodospirillales bacterium]|nr:HAMP domain-containing protein [Rhodospirillales bacterium]
MRVALLPSQSRVVKRVLPRSLLGRSLLIILAPLVLVLAIALQIYYGSHLVLISRRFATSVAGELAAITDLWERTPSPAARAHLRDLAWQQFELRIQVTPAGTLPPPRAPSFVGPVADALNDALASQLQEPYSLDWRSDPQSVLVSVRVANSVLRFAVPRKRLYTGTIFIFVVWLVGSSALLFTIAALFMRNQVRAIRRLAVAAEAFGKGRDAAPIRPEGAAEVRAAAIAFNRMQARITRFIAQRTEMLAGVSHDLRTPLTRLRLGLAVLPVSDAARADVAEMETDIAEMERMIAGYLAFARGEGSETARPVDLDALLADIAERTRRGFPAITYHSKGPAIVPLRPDAMTRAISNLVDNATRQARHVALAILKHDATTVEIAVDDDGPGIAPDRRESVFRPFESGTGGTGLGLAIARDIVHAHGGELMLETSPAGGLRARIALPA